MPEKEPIKILSKNRKARFNYSVEETFEAGIELRGTEVKSMRGGKFSFTDAFGKITANELFLQGFHITPYEFGNINNHDPDRDRKLLIHKDEIRRIRRKVDERGYTIIPLTVYLKKGLVKLEMGVCRGKNTFDKRQSIKNKDIKRETDREVKNRY